MTEGRDDAAGGVAVPTLPVVWRPRVTRLVGYGLALIIGVGLVALAVALPPDWSIADRIGVVLFGGAVVWLIHLLGRCRVAADREGLTVVNAVRTRRLEWAEVVRVNMSPGEPWPTLDLSSGESLPAMGINGAEHARAARQLAELRALLVRYGEAPDR